MSRIRIHLAIAVMAVAAIMASTGTTAAVFQAQEALKAANPLTRLFSLDSYTEYALLTPGSSDFRIMFMPQETRAGSRILINGTRAGSVGKDVEVYDPRTGKPIKFLYLTGAQMKQTPETPGNFVGANYYIRAELPFPVPEGGIGRVLIYKTYNDDRTYYMKGDDIVWVRALGGQRFSVILPKGWAYLSSDIAAQVMGTADGRVKLSFTNQSGAGSPLTVHARKTTARPVANSIYDRAWEDMKTLYDLGDPATHIFTVQQQYTDWRKGEKAKLDILNYVRLAEMRVTDLDTGNLLRVDNSLAELAVPITNDRQSAHLRVNGKTTDPAYKVDRDGDFVWERTLLGLRNTILLPAGWEVSGVSQPATLGTYEGRAFVAIVNNMLGDQKVTIRGIKRGAGTSQ